VSFIFLSSQANSARMIIDGIIPYLCSINRDEVLDFFDPDVILAKSDWEWDEVNKMLIKPLSKDLVELDESDMDYNLISTTINVEGEEEVKSYIDLTTQSAIELTASHLEKVVIGQNDDPISTIGNNNTASRAFILRIIGAATRGSPRSALSVSDQAMIR